jgi:predicted nucleic acid-binding protein
VRLFFDLNIVLDVLARREPWFEHSAAVLSLVDGTETEGYVAAQSITTLHYLLSKYHSRGKAAAALIDVLALVRVVSLDHQTLLKALSLGWSDFEDAVQAVCAAGAGANYLVTRDPRDFPGLSIPVVSPSEVLAILAE